MKREKSMLKALMSKFSTNKVIKAGFWYTVGNFLLKGITFLTIPIFTRLLTTADYGLVNTYMAYEGIISIIIGLGLAGTVKNAKYEFKEEFEDYLSSVIILSLVVFLVALLAGNLFFQSMKNYFEFNKLTLNVLILNSYASFLITFISSKYVIDFEYKKFLVISFLNTIFSVILSLIGIMFVFKSDKYMGRILGQAIPMIVIGIYILISLKGKKSINKKYIKFGLLMGVPLIAHYLSSIILSQFDRIMIQKYIGASEAGIYSCVYNIGLILNVFLVSIESVWNPWLYEKMDKKQYHEISNKSRIYIQLFSIATIGLIALSPEIVKIMAPEEYWSGITLVVPLILSVYFVFLYSLPVNIEYFFKKTKYIALGTIGAALLNILLNIYFMPRLGYEVAAYTTLISYGCLFVFHWIISKGIFKSHMYDLKFIVINTIFVSIFAIIVMILKDYFAIRYILLGFVMLAIFVKYRGDIKIFLSLKKSTD